MVRFRKKKHIEHLLREIHFTKKFRMKVFREKLETNFPKLESDEKDHLFFYLIIKLKTAKKKGRFTNPSLYNEVIKILSYYYFQNKSDYEENYEFKILEPSIRMLSNLEVYLMESGLSYQEIKERYFLLNGGTIDRQNLKIFHPFHPGDEILLLPPHAAKKGPFRKY